MQRPRKRDKWRLKEWPKRFFGAIAGRIAVILFKAVRHAERERVAGVTGRLLCRIGPWLPEQRVARANLRAAFPDKPADEINKILVGSWENLGRVAAEFAFLDRLRIQRADDPLRPDIIYNDVDLRRFEAMRTAPRPTAFFAAHLGNWE